MTYEEQIEWAKNEFKNLENKKQKIILELAQRLSKADMVEDTICEYISEQLQTEGYVTARYVRDVLPEKYKRKYKKNSEATSDIDPNKDPEKIIIGTDGKPINDDKTIKPPANSPKVPPPEEPTELELLKIQVKQQQETIQEKDELLRAEKTRGDQLEDALHQTEQFKPGTVFLGEKSQEEIKEIKDELSSGTMVVTKPLLDDDMVFQYLRDRSKETGNIIQIDRVGSGALVQSLAQYKHSFGVAELFLRIITK